MDVTDHQQNPEPEPKTPASLAARIVTLQRLEDATTDLVQDAFAQGAFSGYARLMGAFVEFRTETQCTHEELREVLAASEADSAAAVG